MKNEHAIQLLIEFDPSNFQGIIVWLPTDNLITQPDRSEVIDK